MDVGQGIRILGKMFTFIVISLACFRLAYLISKEAGPFWAAKKFRWFVKKKSPKKSHMDQGIDCPYCVSLEVSILMSVLALIYPWTPEWIQGVELVFLMALSTSGAAMIIHQIFTKLRGE